MPDRGPRATLKARLRSRPKELQHSYAGLSSGITTTLHKRGEMCWDTQHFGRDTEQSAEALRLWWENELQKHADWRDEARAGWRRLRCRKDVRLECCISCHDATNLRFVWVPDGQKAERTKEGRGGGGRRCHMGRR